MQKEKTRNGDFENPSHPSRESANSGFGNPNVPSTNGESPTNREDLLARLKKLKSKTGNLSDQKNENKQQVPPNLPGNFPNPEENSKQNPVNSLNKLLRTFLKAIQGVSDPKKLFPGPVNWRELEKRLNSLYGSNQGE